MGRGVRTGIDTSRLSRAVSRPGIDPRVWVTLAVVQDVGHDPAEGVFVDVQYQPSGDQETCLLGAAYAGDGFGSYAPVKVGDTVLVAIPGGDPGNGPVVITRLWNAADPPPAGTGEDGEPSRDVSTRVETGAAYRVATDGGNVELNAEDATLKALATLVELAVSPANEAFVRGTSYATALQTFLGALSAQMTLQTTVNTSLAAEILASGLLAPLLPTTQAAAAAAAVGGATFIAALSTFSARLIPGDLLSTKVKGD